MIVTNLSPTLNAVAFQQYYQNVCYAVLGRATSAWSGGSYSDTNPPPENPAATSVDTAFCAFTASVNLMHENDSTGAYSFVIGGVTKKFDIVGSTSTFISNGDNHVMLLASTSSDNIIALEPEFRVVGFETNLTPTGGHTSDAFLPNANISSYGNLQTLANLEPQTLVTHGTTTVQALLTF